MKNRKRMSKSITIILFVILAIVALKYFTRDIWDVNAVSLKREIQAIDEHTELISLDQLTPFEWDTIYSFAPYTSTELIYEVVGYKWDKISEMLTETGQQIIFLKEGKVVCYIHELTSKSGFSLDLKERSRLHSIPMATSDNDLGFQVIRTGNTIYLKQL